MADETNQNSKNTAPEGVDKEAEGCGRLFVLVVVIALLIPVGAFVLRNLVWSIAHIAFFVLVVVLLITLLGFLFKSKKK
jgi:hypothetical protein